MKNNPFKEAKSKVKLERELASKEQENEALKKELEELRKMLKK